MKAKLKIKQNLKGKTFRSVAVHMYPHVPVRSAESELNYYTRNPKETGFEQSFIIKLAKFLDVSYTDVLQRYCFLCREVEVDFGTPYCPKCEKKLKTK